MVAASTSNGAGCKAEQGAPEPRRSAQIRDIEHDRRVPQHSRIQRCLVGEDQLEAITGNGRTPRLVSTVATGGSTSGQPAAPARGRERGGDNRGIVHGAPDGMAVTQAVAAFDQVRGLPYAIDAAHDADSLDALARGDCLAKSDLLARRLRRLGFRVRMVRWLYLLPDVVPETRELPSRLDMHRAVEVWSRRGWILVDATHDPALARAGLTVTEWDGISSTQAAYPPVGPLWVEGRDSDEIANGLARVRRWVDACPPLVLERWREAYIRWLDQARVRS